MALKTLLILLLLTSPSWAAVAFGVDCHTGNEDDDTLTLNCEITSCPSGNPILIASITREEAGDDEPDALTWNGDALTKIVSDNLTTGDGEVFQYYLLNPDVGTYDLIVTWSASASVDTVLGLITICGAKQQAPEANCASGTDVNSCVVTSVTANAFLVSTGGSTTNQTWAIDGGGDLDTEAYEQASPPAFGTDGCMGYGDTAAAGNYNCAWTNSGSSDNASVLCTAWEVASEAAPSMEIMMID